MGLSTIKSIIAADQQSAWHDEIENRKYLTSRLIFTKIKQIDYAFKGLWPNDFVVLSAASGTGKTELVTQIAMNVASQHKYVDLFALEAARYEIQRRIKFKILSALYYEDTKQTDISYSDWMRFKLDERLAKYQPELEKRLEVLKKYLRIHYRPSTFDLKDFMKLYNYYAKDSELVLCDHAQFFDFDDSKNENQHVKDMTLKIYDSINATLVPVVLVSHLRKTKDGKMFADMNDVYGSSELVKKATRMLLISRGKFNPEIKAFSTVFNFQKNREESVTCLQTMFNLGLKQYSGKFEVGVIERDEFVAYDEV